MSSTTSDTIRERDRAASRRRGWSRARWLRLVLMIALPLAVAITGSWWYLTTGRYVSTDDAYVQADTVWSAATSPAVSSRSRCTTTNT